MIIVCLIQQNTQLTKAIAENDKLDKMNEHLALRQELLNKQVFLEQKKITNTRKTIGFKFGQES